MPTILTLTTDFGQVDGYVGTMKGVILAQAPLVQLVDLSHDLPPGDIAAGALLLARSVPYFPPGTIHLAVVDPGVGTKRRAVLLQTEDGCFVGPDNGLLSYILLGAVARAAHWQGQPESVPALWNPGFDFASVLSAAPAQRLPSAYHLNNPAYWLAGPSATFHGRDIFAPVAAHLAAGVAPNNLGTPLALETLVMLPSLAPTLSTERIEGFVIACDRFGNLISNVAAGLLETLGPLDALRVLVASHRFTGIQQTYGAVSAGQTLALINSARLLEIAVSSGNAARQLGVSIGAAVLVTKKEESSGHPADTPGAEGKAG